MATHNESKEIYGLIHTPFVETSIKVVIVQSFLRYDTYQHPKQIAIWIDCKILRCNQFRGMLLSNIFDLDQCSPTLLPLATRDLNVARDNCSKWISYDKWTTSLKFLQKWLQKNLCRHSSSECGDRENLVGHQWSRTNFKSILISDNQF
jgi:hypothetical protein